MDSKEKRSRDCSRKRQYFSRKQARKNAERAGGIYGEKLYFYKCQLCKNYHLTRTNQKISYAERMKLKSANAEV